MKIKVGHWAAAFVIAAASLVNTPAVRAQTPDALAQKSNDASGLIAASRRDGYVRIIVEFKEPATLAATEPADMAAVEKDIVAAQNAIIARHFGSATVPRPATGFQRALTRFAISAGFVVNATLAEVRSLASDPDVVALREDIKLAPLLTQSVPLMGMTVPAGPYHYGATGRGQAVAIIDTGVQSNHPFLTGKVIEEACFSTTSGTLNGICPSGTNPGAGRAVNCTFNGCEHGTHVAGIAAGFNTKHGIPPNGVAKDAKIVAIQVASRESDPKGCAAGPPCARFLISDVIRALEFIVKHPQVGNIPIAAVNLSIGAGAFQDACDSQEPLATSLINRLLKFGGRGIATVAGSGNSGYADAISWPACITNVIAVGSMDKTNKISSFGNRGKMLDVLAYGESINSSIPGSKYTYLNGTSLASPHVAGLITALRSYAPNATVAQIQGFYSGFSVNDPASGRNYITLSGNMAMDRMLPVLTVTPPTIYPFSYHHGRPLPTATRTFTLKSTTDRPVNWRVTGVPSWLTATPVSGAAPKSGIAVKLELSNKVSALVEGSYAATITFKNVATGKGTQTRDVRVDVVTPQIYPTNAQGTGVVTLPNFLPIGSEGGPFAPASYQLYLKASEGAVPFTVKTPSWLTAIPKSGTATTTPLSVSLFVNGNANKVPHSLQSDSVKFASAYSRYLLPCCHVDPMLPTLLTVRPRNDNFDHALPVFSGLPALLDYNGHASATTETGEPGSCYGTLWWKFKAPATAAYRISTADTTYFNSWLSVRAQRAATLAIYTGATVNALTNIAAATTFPVVLNATANTTYYFQVCPNTASSSSGYTGDITSVRVTVDPNPGSGLHVASTFGDDIAVFGLAGGIVQTPSFEYYLSDSFPTGGTNINFSATGVPDWLTLTPGSTGTILSTLVSTLKFTVNSAAFGRSAGTYSSTISFNNTSDGAGTQTRKASLVISPAQSLQLAPLTGLNFKAIAGADFTPQNVTLGLGASSGTVGYKITGVPAWLDVSAAAGTLSTAWENVTVGLNSAANALPSGTYTATLGFTNTTNGRGNQTRKATLVVQ